VRAWRALRRDADRDADRAWARAALRPAEYAIWIRQTAYDRRHSVRVARRVEQRLEGTPYAGDARWLAAALMHDVGKAVAGLSPLSRAAAAFVNRIVDLETARRWARSGAGRRRRIGLYLIHGEVGARLIRDAGGREEIAAWSEAHQGEGIERVPGFPPAVVAALTGSDVA
jgi:hypothetical protein